MDISGDLFQIIASCEADPYLAPSFGAIPDDPVLSLLPPISFVAGEDLCEVALSIMIGSVIPEATVGDIRVMLEALLTDKFQTVFANGCPASSHPHDLKLRRKSPVGFMKLVYGSFLLGPDPVGRLIKFLHEPLRPLLMLMREHWENCQVSGSSETDDGAAPADKHTAAQPAARLGSDDAIPASVVRDPEYAVQVEVRHGRVAQTVASPSNDIIEGRPQNTSVLNGAIAAVDLAKHIIDTVIPDTRAHNIAPPDADVPEGNAVDAGERDVVVPLATQEVALPPPQARTQAATVEGDHRREPLAPVCVNGVPVPERRPTTRTARTAQAVAAAGTMTQDAIAVRTVAATRRSVTAAPVLGMPAAASRIPAASRPASAAITANSRDASARVNGATARSTLHRRVKVLSALAKENVPPPPPPIQNQRPRPKMARTASNRAPSAGALLARGATVTSPVPGLIAQRKRGRSSSTDHDEGVKGGKKMKGGTDGVDLSQWTLSRLSVGSTVGSTVDTPTRKSAWGRTLCMSSVYGKD